MELEKQLRDIVRDELKKAGLTNFNDEMDAIADEKLEEFFNEYDLEEKFTKHCEKWIVRNQPATHEFIRLKEFNELFDEKLSDVTLSR